MLVIIRLVALIWSALGVIILVKPDAFSRIITFCKQGNRMSTIGIIRIVIGIIFLIAASKCKVSAVVTVLGILILIKGVLVFALNRKKINSIIAWWEKKPFSTIRALSLVVIALAFLLLNSI